MVYGHSNTALVRCFHHFTRGHVCFSYLPCHVHSALISGICTARICCVAQDSLRMRRCEPGLLAMKRYNLDPGPVDSWGDPNRCTMRTWHLPLFLWHFHESNSTLVPVCHGTHEPSCILNLETLQFNGGFAGATRTGETELAGALLPIDDTLMGADVAVVCPGLRDSQDLLLGRKGRRVDWSTLAANMHAPMRKMASNAMWNANFMRCEISDIRGPFQRHAS